MGWVVNCVDEAESVWSLLFKCKLLMMIEFDKNEWSG